MRQSIASRYFLCCCCYRCRYSGKFQQRGDDLIGKHCTLSIIFLLLSNSSLYLFQEIGLNNNNNNNKGNSLFWRRSVSIPIFSFHPFRVSSDLILSLLSRPPNLVSSSLVSIQCTSKAGNSETEIASLLGLGSGSGSGSTPVDSSPHRLILI